MTFRQRFDREYIYPQKYAVAYIVFFGFLSTILQLANPLLLKVIIDDGYLVRNFNFVYYMVALAVLLYMLERSSYMVMFRGVVKALYQTDMKMKNRFFNHLQNLDHAFLKTVQIGDVGKIASQDIYDLGSYFCAYIYAISDSLAILFITIVMFYLNPLLATISVFTIPLMFFSRTYHIKKMYSSYSKNTQENNELSIFNREHLNSVKLIQENGAEDVILNKFNDRLKNVMKSLLFYRRTLDSNRSFTEFITYLGTAAVLFCGGFLVIRNKMTIGELMAFYGMIFYLHSSVKNLSHWMTRTLNGKIYAERFYKYLDIAPTVIDNADAKDFKIVNGEVVFQSVYFSFDSEKTLLKNFNLKIKAGETVALVGKSGAGKSTIASLLLRFYDIEKGTIKIDGQNLSDFTLKSLRSQIGIVSQDAIMFHTTILENLQIAGQNLTLAEVEQACKTARIHNFIDSLPVKYQTIVGDKGIKLSGGEKQRLSLARTLLRNPKILILDEASSHLDNQNEKDIFAELDKFRAGRTTIIIAHRLSTVRNCDNIYVFDQGEIKENGKYTDLIAKQGLFWQLWQQDQRLSPASEEIGQ